MIGPDWRKPLLALLLLLAVATPALAGTDDLGTPAAVCELAKISPTLAERLAALFGLVVDLAKCDGVTTSPMGGVALLTMQDPPNRVLG